MNLDFDQLYKDYSNTDLLKIVREPGNYQPEAVSIAAKILNEREIVPEEIQYVDQYYQDIESSKRARKEKLDTVKDKATDFMQPILYPTEKVELTKWVNILLLVIAIQYVWTLFNTLKRLIIFLKCTYCTFYITEFADVLTLLYVPLIFILVFKKKRWGWILLFADNLFSLISGGVSKSYFFFKFQNIPNGDLTTFILPILIKLAFVFFLWRNEISNYFRVTIETKKKTALITTGGTTLLILIMFFLSGL